VSLRLRYSNELETEAPQKEETGNVAPIFRKERLKGQSGDLQAGQPHVGTWEKHGVSPPETYFWAQESEWEESA